MTQLTNAVLDTLFEPRGATTKRADIGIQTNGIDISNRYMQPSQGGTATATATNIMSNGLDIATLFTQIGTVINQSITWVGSISLSATGTTLAIVNFSLGSDGTTAQTGTGTTVGDWLTTVGAGNGSLYECRASSISGSVLSSGPTVFTPISSNVLFSLNGNSTKSTSFNVDIREIANPANTFTRACTLSITVTGGGFGGGL